MMLYDVHTFSILLKLASISILTPGRLRDLHQTFHHGYAISEPLQLLTQGQELRSPLGRWQWQPRLRSLGANLRVFRWWVGEPTGPTKHENKSCPIWTCLLDSPKANHGQTSKTSTHHRLGKSWQLQPCCRIPVGPNVPPNRRLPRWPNDQVDVQFPNPSEWPRNRWSSAPNDPIDPSRCWENWPLLWLCDPWKAGKSNRSSILAW